MQKAPQRVIVTRWFRSRSAALVVLAVVAFLFVYPIVMLIIGAFRNADPTLPAQWGWQSFQEVYSNPRTYETLATSGVFAVSTTVLALLLAVYLAFLSARTLTPLRRLITPVAVIVLALPPTFFAISWGMLGNERVGSINEVIGLITGTEFSLLNINSWFGVIFVTVLHMAAVTYLLLIGPFTALDRSLEEAAQVAGAGAFRTFFTIDVPVLAPTILGVAILGFVRGLEAFDVPIILGTPAGIYVIATEIYGQIQNFTPPNYGGASALSVILLVLVIILVFLQWRALGKRQFVTVAGKNFRRERWDIGRWKFAGTAVIALYVLLAVILPVVQLGIGALQPYFGARFGLFTLDHIESALTTPELTDAITLTLILAIVCGALASVFSAVASYLIARSRSRITKLVELSIWLPWAVPGVVLSLAFAWAFLAVPGLRSLYGTPWILALALTVSVVPIAMRPIQGAIAQLSQELEDAARTNGATASRMFFGIVIRIIAPSFIAAWFVSAILVSGNLAVPTLLSGVGNKTVPILVFQLYTNGAVVEAAALLLVYLVIMFAIIGLLWILYRIALGAVLRGRPSVEQITPAPPVVGVPPDADSMATTEASERVTTHHSEVRK